MKRTVLLLSIFLLATLISGWVNLAEAQQAGKVYRIGFLTPHSRSTALHWFQAFREGLRDLGWVEGKNIVIDERWAEGRQERLPTLAAELVRFKPDVIVAHSNPKPAARAAKDAGVKIPIVFPLAADPVGRGFVASLARPGGNITGLSSYHTDLVPKRLELLKEVAPSALRIAVLWNPATSLHPGQWKLILAVAPKLGVTLLSLEVRRPEDFDLAFSTMRKERPGSLIVLGHASIRKHSSRIFRFAIKNRLPAIYTHRGWVAGGGLMSYGADFDDLYRRAATYVDKILKGAKPADLPVEQPRKFDLVINLKTAKKIGLKIPPVLLLQATEVIK